MPPGGRSAASLTPSVADVAVPVGHPDLLQRVLGELPRVALQQDLLVVQHLGWIILASRLRFSLRGGGIPVFLAVCLRLHGSGRLISAEKQSVFFTLP